MTPSTPKQRSHLISLLIMGMGIVAGVIWGMPLVALKNSWGFVIILGVPLLFVAIWGLANRQSYSESGKKDETPARNRRVASRLALALAAFLIGPLGAAAITVASLFVFDVHPLDRENTVVSVTTIGLIAGLVVALTLGLSALFE